MLLEVFKYGTQTIATKLNSRVNSQKLWKAETEQE